MQPELGILRDWAQNPTFKIKAYVDIYVITELMKITRLTHKEQENQSICIKTFLDINILHQNLNQNTAWDKCANIKTMELEKMISADNIFLIMGFF